MYLCLKELNQMIFNHSKFYVLSFPKNAAKNISNSF